MNEQPILERYWPALVAAGLYVALLPLWILIGGTTAGLVCGCGWVWPQRTGLIVAINVFAHPTEPWSAWATPQAGPPAVLQWITMLVAMAVAMVACAWLGSLGQRHLISARRGFASGSDVRHWLSAQTVREAANHIRPDLPGGRQ